MGSGIKGHTTAKELATKRFEALDKARNKADALAEKDILDGQRMIDNAAKDSEAAFEQMLEQEDKTQYTVKMEKIKQQEKAGWDLRVKGQNRKSEISDKYGVAATKLMSLPQEDESISTESVATTEDSILLESKKVDVIGKEKSHEDSLIKVENIIKDYFPSYPLDYTGDLITTDTLKDGTTVLNAYIPTEDRGTNPQYGEVSPEELKSFEGKWKPVIAKLQNQLRIQGFRNMEVTMDYGEKGHIGVQVFGTLKEDSKPKSKPKEQSTLTQDAPKTIPKSHLLATKYAEAAAKRGTLFRELGKKSKKELKAMIQQESQIDMTGALRGMTKSDMKYHLTGNKYPSSKASEEAYNALTRQERKGLLKPIPDPKTPKAKGVRTS